ncbi:hypothetical protein MMC26_001546 [Xylographa opegraphella]|nr:hypothetical protein [Xylographa opegraphella]
MPEYRDNEEVLRARHRRSSASQQALIPQEDDAEIVEQIYVHRRHGSHDAYGPRRSPVDYRDDYSRRASRSTSSQRRYSTFTDTNTEALSPGAPRRRSSNRDGFGVIPYYGTLDHEIQRRESRHSRRSSRDSRRSSSTDSDVPMSETEADEQKKLRNKKYIYTGLAGITTIAAANNIYQSTKAHETRRKSHRETWSSDPADIAEARSKRNKAILMDIFSVGVAAVCVNNAVNGWKKATAESEAYNKFSDEKAENERLAQRLLAAPEVQKSIQQEIAWVEPDYRQRRASSTYVR